VMTIDHNIVSQAQQGDRAAFRVLAETHKTELYQLAYGILGNHHDAEDALQETFISAYRGLANFRSDAAVGSWLYRIAVNRCLDLQRRRKPLVPIAAGEAPEAGEIAELEEGHPGGNPERRRQSGRIREAVRLSLELLSPLERAVFVLRHDRELAIKDIAQTLERSEGTVKNILFRAVRKVRDYLKCQNITLEEASP